MPFRVSETGNDEALCKSNALGVGETGNAARVRGVPLSHDVAPPGVGRREGLADGERHLHLPRGEVSAVVSPLPCEGVVDGCAGAVRKVEGAQRAVHRGELRLPVLRSRSSNRALRVR